VSRKPSQQQQKKLIGYLSTGTFENAARICHIRLNLPKNIINSLPEAPTRSPNWDRGRVFHVITEDLINVSIGHMGDENAAHGK